MELNKQIKDVLNKYKKKARTEYNKVNITPSVLKPPNIVVAKKNNRLFLELDTNNQELIEDIIDIINNENVAVSKFETVNWNSDKEDTILKISVEV